MWSQKLASPNLQCGLTAWRPRKANGVLQVQRPVGGDPGYMIVEDIGRQSAGESCLHKETSLFFSIQVFQFHGGSDSKESACKCRRPRFDPQVMKIPWRRGFLSVSSILAWEIPWTEEPGGLPFMGQQRVGPTEQLSLSLLGMMLCSNYSQKFFSYRDLCLKKSLRPDVIVIAGIQCDAGCDMQWKQNYLKPLSLVIISPAEPTVKSYKNTQ